MGTGSSFTVARARTVAADGLAIFNSIGCQSCHIQNLQINHDRRVANVDTGFYPVNGIFNELFSQATTLTSAMK